ncbi:MAG TPA: peptide ABC transporter substrate-binding protein [Opitutaceae bacterium]|nr:peptide ABC transporter substrate-binding protein [Opitutaceae bacterium]
MILRRSLRAAWLGAAVGASLLAAGCGRKAGTAAGGKGGGGEQVLRMGNGAEPQDLDPQAVEGIPELNIIQALFDSLVEPDPHDLHPVPGLAETWEVSPDGLVYTFHLRPNLRWSNGDPLTSDDFIQSYKRILTPSLGSDYANYFYNYVQGAKDYYEGKVADFSRVGVRAPDPRTLVITLSHPTPFLLEMIACHFVWDPLPIKVVAKFGPLGHKGSAWTRAGNLVASGPFMLKEWIPNKRVVVVRNPNYWDAGRVKLDRIEFYPTDDLGVEEHMFRTGQIDRTYDFDRSKVEFYRQHHPDELKLEPWLGSYYYVFNVHRAPFTDVRVRRALSLAIDREQIVKAIMRGGETPAYSVDPPNDSGYTAQAQLQGDLAEARRLLAEAGYPGGRGFPPIHLLYNQNQGYHRSVAEAIQAMWRKNLGIELTLSNQEWKVYLDSLNGHNFQLGRAGWIADYPDPDVFLEIFETGNVNNDGEWSNPEYDRLLHQAMNARTQAERYAIYQRMDRILVDQCPVMPIFYYTKVYALRPTVKGWWPTLLDEHPYKYVYLQH